MKVVIVLMSFLLVLVTSKPPHCFLEASYGKCDRLLHMWYYSHNEDMCVIFGYSGCGGNANRFKTQEQCELSCYWRV